MKHGRISANLDLLLLVLLSCGGLLSPLVLSSAAVAPSANTTAALRTACMRLSQPLLCRSCLKHTTINASALAAPSTENVSAVVGGQLWPCLDGVDMAQAVLMYGPQGPLLDRMAAGSYSFAASTDLTWQGVDFESWGDTLLSLLNIDVDALYSETMSSVESSMLSSSPHLSMPLPLTAPAVQPTAVLIDGVMLGTLIEHKSLLDLHDLTLSPPLSELWGGMLPITRAAAAIMSPYGNTSTQSYVSAVPLGGSTSMLMFYRTDVLRAYNMTVPEDWGSFVQMAARLNGTDLNGDGRADYGVCLTSAPGCLQDTYNLMAIAGSLIQSQGMPQGCYLAPQTLEPLIANNAATVEAMRLYQLLRALGPQPAIPSNSTAKPDCKPVSDALLQGRCAFAFGWSAHFKAIHTRGVPRYSPLTATAPIPGSFNVLDRDSRSLLPCTAQSCPYATKGPNGRLLNKTPFIALGPLSGGIRAGAPPAEQAVAALLLAEASAEEAVWARVLNPNDTLTAPFRFEHFSSEGAERWAWAGYPRAATATFLQQTFSLLKQPNRVRELRTVGGPQFRRALQQAALMLAPPPPAKGVPRTPPSTPQSAAGWIDAHLWQALGQRMLYLAQQYASQIDGDVVFRESRPPPIQESPTVLPSTMDHSSHFHSVMVPVLSTVLPTLMLLAGGIALLRMKLRRANWARLTVPGLGPDSTLLVTDIEGSTAMWEELPAAVMDQVFTLHHDCIRATSLQHHGYESQTEGDSFILAFHRPEHAVVFSLDLQLKLMDMAWPSELLDRPACRPIWICPGNNHVQSTGILKRSLDRQRRPATPKGALHKPWAKLVQARDRGSSVTNGSSDDASSAAEPAQSASYLGADTSVREQGGVYMGSKFRPGLSTLDQRLQHLTTLSQQQDGSVSSALRLLPFHRHYERRKPGSLLGSRDGALYGAGQAVSAGLSMRRRIERPGVVYPEGSDAFTPNSDPALPLCSLAKELQLQGLHPTAAAKQAARPPLGPSATAAAESGASIPAAVSLLTTSTSTIAPPLSIVLANASSGDADFPHAFLPSGVTLATMLQSNQAHMLPSMSTSPRLPPAVQRPAAGSPTGSSGQLGSPLRQRAGSLAGSASQFSVPACSPTPSQRSGSVSSSCPGNEPLDAVSLRCKPKFSITCNGSPFLNASLQVHSSPRGSPMHADPSHARSGSRHMSLSGAAATCKLTPLPEVQPDINVGGTHAHHLTVSAPDLMAPRQSSDQHLHQEQDDRVTASSADIFSGRHTMSSSQAASTSGNITSSNHDTFNTQSSTACLAQARMTSGMPLASCSMMSGSIYGYSAYQLAGDGSVARPDKGGTVETLAIAMMPPSAMSVIASSHAAATEADCRSPKEDVPPPGGHISPRPDKDTRGSTSRSQEQYGLFFSSLMRSGSSFTGATTAGRSSKKAPLRNSSTSSTLGAIATQLDGLTRSVPALVRSTRQLPPEPLTVDPWQLRPASQSDRVLPPAPPLRSLSNPFAAPLKVMPETYGEGLRKAWVECPAGTARAVLIWRGVRVRIGIHSGIHSSADLVYSKLAARWKYSGTLVAITKAISDAAVGGMVLVSAQTRDRLQAELIGSDLLAWHMGDHELNAQILAAALYQVLNTRLLARVSVETRPLQTLRTLSLGVLEAPQHIVAYALLKLALPVGAAAEGCSANNAAIAAFHAITYQQLMKLDGYAAYVAPGCCAATFRTAYAAALWAALCQEQALRHTLPTAPGGRGSMLSTGQMPATRGVVHVGPTASVVSVTTGRMEYDGKTVRSTIRILSGTAWGAVVATSEAVSALKAEHPSNSITTQQRLQRRVPSDVLDPSDGQPNATAVQPTSGRSSLTSCRASMSPLLSWQQHMRGGGTASRHGRTSTCAHPDLDSSQDDSPVPGSAPRALSRELSTLGRIVLGGTPLATLIVDGRQSVGDQDAQPQLSQPHADWQQSGRGAALWHTMSQRSGSGLWRRTLPTPPSRPRNLSLPLLQPATAMHVELQSAKPPCSAVPTQNDSKTAPVCAPQLTPTAQTSGPHTSSPTASSAGCSWQVPSHSQSVDATSEEGNLQAWRPLNVQSQPESQPRTAASLLLDLAMQSPLPPGASARGSYLIIDAPMVQEVGTAVEPISKAYSREFGFGHTITLVNNDMDALAGPQFQSGRLHAEAQCLDKHVGNAFAELDNGLPPRRTPANLLASFDLVPVRPRGPGEREIGSASVSVSDSLPLDCLHGVHLLLQQQQQQNDAPGSTLISGDGTSAGAVAQSGQAADEAAAAEPPAHSNLQEAGGLLDNRLIAALGAKEPSLALDVNQPRQHTTEPHWPPLLQQELNSASLPQQSDLWPASQTTASPDFGSAGLQESLTHLSSICPRDSIESSVMVTAAAAAAASPLLVQSGGSGELRLEVGSKGRQLMWTGSISRATPSVLHGALMASLQRNSPTSDMAVAADGVAINAAAESWRLAAEAGLAAATAVEASKPASGIIRSQASSFELPAVKRQGAVAMAADTQAAVPLHDQDIELPQPPLRDRCESGQQLYSERTSQHSGQCELHPAPKSAHEFSTRSLGTEDFQTLAQSRQDQLQHMAGAPLQPLQAPAMQPLQTSLQQQELQVLDSGIGIISRWRNSLMDARWSVESSGESLVQTDSRPTALQHHHQHTSNIPSPSSPPATVESRSGSFAASRMLQLFKPSRHNMSSSSLFGAAAVQSPSKSGNLHRVSLARAAAAACGSGNDNFTHHESLRISPTRSVDLRTVLFGSNKNMSQAANGLQVSGNGATNRVSSLGGSARAPSSGHSTDGVGEGLSIVVKDVQLQMLPGSIRMGRSHKSGPVYRVTLMPGVADALAVDVEGFLKVLQQPAASQASLGGSGAGQRPASAGNAVHDGQDRKEKDCTLGEHTACRSAVSDSTPAMQLHRLLFLHPGIDAAV